MDYPSERILSSSLPSMKSTPSLLMHAKKQGLKGSRIGSPSVGRRNDSGKRSVPSQQLRRKGSKGFIDGDSSSDAAQFALVFTVTSTLMDLLPASLCCGQYMGVVPVLFTQGINEQQTMANRSHATDLRVQTHINKTSLETLTAYFIRFTCVSIPPAPRCSSVVAPPLCLIVTADWSVLADMEGVPGQSWRPSSPTSTRPSELTGTSRRTFEFCTRLPTSQGES